MRYRETLYVPVSYWIIGAAFGLTFVVALAAYLPPLAGVAVSALGTAVVVGGLLWFSRTRIRVSDTDLRVGPFRIDGQYIERARALDAHETARRLNLDADAQALLVTRPYLTESVEVTLNDPGDPHPYWLVSSRRPRALARAIAALPGGCDRVH